MKLIVKVFPEITIKSPPVRKGFIRQLTKNIRAVLKDLDPALQVEGVWDNIEVETSVGEAKALRENEDVKEFYLGIAEGKRKSFRDVKHYKRRKRWLA